MSRCPTKIACIAALGALAAGPAVTPAHAVDGVLEVNQACVAAGCFTGDGPGFPVEIANPGSYRLTGNLTVPDDDTTAIVLQARFVTLDLNGFSIVGQYDCGPNPPNCPGGSARAIDAGDTDGSRIHNGGIRQFGGGALRLGGLSLIEDLRIREIGGDGIVSGLGSLVRGNLVGDIRGDGIKLEFGNPPLPGDGLIEGNVVRVTGGDGIEADFGILLGNRVVVTAGADALLGVSAAYGKNAFSEAPLGGTSLGDNLCGGSLC